jgi:hypothetical protein
MAVYNKMFSPYIPWPAQVTYIYNHLFTYSHIAW